MRWRFRLPSGLDPLAVSSGVSLLTAVRLFGMKFGSHVGLGVEVAYSNEMCTLGVGKGPCWNDLPPVSLLQPACGGLEKRS